MLPSKSIKTLTAAHFRWEAWEQLIKHNGYTIDRPRQHPHPTYPNIIYPIDYGYINDTVGTDGEEVDVFVGNVPTKLVAVIVTADTVRQDREFKLLYNCSPEEVYLVHGFINYMPELLSGRLVMRRPMHELWAQVAKMR